MRMLNRYPISIYNIIGIILFFCDILFVEDIYPWWIVIGYLFSGVLCLVGLIWFVVTYPFILSISVDIEMLLLIPLSVVMGFFLDYLLRKIRIKVYDCKL